jgi:hypothetical protein
MDCMRCTENLTAYLDGELSQVDSSLVRSHLEICESCAVELRSFEAASNFVASHASRLELRSQSWDAVCDRISAAGSRPPFAFLILKRWSSALATLAVVLAVAFGYLYYQQDQRKSLDEYISQYLKMREAGRTFGLMTSSSGLPLQSGNPVVNNPFIEVKPAFDANPFRLEDR